MLSKTVAPKTKADLIRALQGASIRSFEVYEGVDLKNIPTVDRLRSSGATAVILR